MVPTIIDNALALGLTPNKEVGIGFQPTTRDIADVDGEISFGGFDSRRFFGDFSSVYVNFFYILDSLLMAGLMFRPFTTTAPSSNYIGIDQSVTYGSSSATVLPTTAGIIDSSTNLLLLASGV